MLSPTALRRWSWTHKWSSLVCTVFMLLLCITGLPLIFHHEIGHLLGTEVEAPAMPANTPRASLDKVLATAHALHPDRVVQFASHAEDDDNVWFVTLTPTPAPTDDFRSVAVDARTGQVLAQPRFDEGFMHVMFRLHVDLFAGLPGKLFLGFMGLLLLVAIVTGVVLYAPFVRKLAFGEVRRDRSTRVKWLDLHNLLGIVTLVWAFVVGGTGMINTWADLGGLPLMICGCLLFVSATGLVLANSISGALGCMPEFAGSASALAGALQYGAGIFGSALVAIFADGTPWPMGLVLAVCGVGCLVSAVWVLRAPDDR